MPVRLLVTGTQGQLARAMIERAALQPGVECVCMGRPQLDLEKPETIERAIRLARPDVVIGAAAYTAVDRAEDEPQMAMWINGEAPWWLARAANTVGARFVHISTDYVFDGTKSGPYVETDEVDPKNVYGRSKLIGEMRVRSACSDAVILRTSWLYSPFGHNFVKTILELAEVRDQLTVVDDQYGCPTSAFDVADAILAIVNCWALDPAAGVGECYHCSGSDHVTWYEVAQHILATSCANGGPSADVLPIASGDWPTQATRPLNSQLDCSKFFRDFGWKAEDWRTSVDAVVRRLLALKVDQ